MLSVSGCRFGGYAGSVRGRGTADMTAGDPNDPFSNAPAPERSTSVALSSYDLTSDIVFKRFSVLTSFGGGGMRVRTRTADPATMTATLDQQDDVLDIHAGLGAGVELVRTTKFRVMAFGMLTKALFSIVSESELSSRYALGLELDMSVSREDDFAGIAARIGYTYGAGEYLTDSSSQAIEVSAILFQVGVWLFVDPAKKR